MLRDAIARAYRADETEIVEGLLAKLPYDPRGMERIAARARQLIEAVRKQAAAGGGIEKFLQEYQLSTPEGIVLLCLAEALLRIPDAETADRLIRDKLGQADWQSHLGRSDSLLVNASTWALMLTGRVVALEERQRGLRDLLGRMVARSGEPVIRTAVKAAMRILGRQFVMGRTIEEAIARARPMEAKGYRYSYDMLGEAARTADDARRYFEAYAAAIKAIGAAGRGRPAEDRPTLSVKLSALHPRYEEAQRARVMAELRPRLLDLCIQAHAAGVGIAIDAEESERLEISLDLIEAVALAPELKDWSGLGMAVQAYQKRALPVLDWVADLAARRGHPITVRLVKGAYWDSEIKRTQERGLDSYAVFTRKAATDVSYLACARRMLAAPEIYPAFATHNAMTLSAVLEMAGNRKDWEFQRLHGMGEALYDEVVGYAKLDRPCRVYAPVGSHEDLLAYLVRRLLENGANTSFVNQVADPDAPIDGMLVDPAETVRRLPLKPHPRIPLPRLLYGPERPNARGIDLSDRTALTPLMDRMAAVWGEQHEASAWVGGKRAGAAARPVLDPADRRRVVGTVGEATAVEVDKAAAVAQRAATDWAATDVETRARCLERAADAMEADLSGFMALAVREAGKTIPDAVAEVREAVDFCRYYALRARVDFPFVPLPGPTGETNRLGLTGRGPFACLSPWNFPLAIFTGQVVAALVAGNPVLAKPAPQTPLIADRAVRLLHAAGIPDTVLQLLPGGTEVGKALIGDPRIAGVAFTGSTETARAINRALAGRDGPILPLIAETGGQNALIADSSALPEQVVADLITSAFQSAGQRCSAARVLFVQDEVAPRILRMLAGAVGELRIGDPGLLATDVGPVIDEVARDRLAAHLAALGNLGKVVVRRDPPPGLENGCFFGPVAVEIDRLDRLTREVFGPVLHVVRFDGERLDQVVDAVNATGYGLTLGIHSRIDETVQQIIARARVGNIYVNRSMIGAVVGVQPFGGEGLSGTGPKAGGPRYLARFATERTITVDTTSAGGNAALLSLSE